MFQLRLDGRVGVGQLKSILVGKKPACAKAWGKKDVNNENNVDDRGKEEKPVWVEGAWGDLDQPFANFIWQVLGRPDWKGEKAKNPSIMCLQLHKIAERLVRPHQILICIHMQFWFSESGVRPETLKFYQTPRWCQCCWFKDYSVWSKGINYLLQANFFNSPYSPKFRVPGLHSKLSGT